MQSTKRHLVLSVFVLAAVVVPTRTFAQRALPVEKMEIQGFRLGMSAEEVRDRLKELGYTVTSVSPSFSKDPIYNRELTNGIVAERGNEYARFKFTSRLPEDQARPTTLYAIFYKIPSTDENAKSLRTAAIAKYGPPTVANWSWWCANPGKTACLKPKQPILTLGYGNLQLEDQTAFDRVDAYLEAQLSTKAKL